MDTAQIVVLSVFGAIMLITIIIGLFIHTYNCGQEEGKREEKNKLTSEKLAYRELIKKGWFEYEVNKQTGDIKIKQHEIPPYNG